MFSIKDYSYFEDVTVMEIIDELHKQFSDKLWDFQGVRIVSDTVYICLSQKESLQVTERDFLSKKQKRLNNGKGRIFLN